MELNYQSFHGQLVWVFKGGQKLEVTLILVLGLQLSCLLNWLSKLKGKNWDMLVKFMPSQHSYWSSKEL